MSDENIYFDLRLQSDQGEHNFHCTGDNTELYTHHPNFRDVDHLFHRYDETDRRIGAFVWRSILGEDEFERIRQYIYGTGAYTITYRPEPTEGDFEQFLRYESQDIQGM